MRTFVVCALAVFLGSVGLAQEQKKTEPPKHVVKEAVCHRTAAPIEVDGSLLDWQDVDARAAMVIGEAETVQKPKRYKGPKDASALVYMKWDDNHLYVAAVVTDDVVRNSNVEKKLQEGDGILLCLSPKTPAEASETQAEQRAPRYPYGFIFTAGEGEKVKPQFMVILDGASQPLIPEGPWQKEVKTAVKRTRSGYNLEFSLPFSALPDLKPAVGKAIGGEVCVYEGDARLGPTKRTTILGWSSVQDRMDPREGGKLTFADAGKEKPAQTPGAVKAEELVKNPYQPAGEEYAARKPHDAFAAAGMPFGLYFERTQREGILNRLKNEHLQRLFERTTSLCESYLLTWRPEEYSLKDLSAGDAETISKVIQRLGFFYTLTEEDQYADLARRTMLRVCEQNANWAARLDSPERLRVAAQLLRGLAIGSDWVHNALNLEERDFVEKSICEIGGRLQKAAGAAKIAPSDSVVILSSLGVCGAATRQRNPNAKEWMLAAEKASADYAASNKESDADALDAALFAIFALVDPLKKAIGHDLFSMSDMRAVLARSIEMLKTRTPSGSAIDVVAARYNSRLLACTLLRGAAENRDGIARWLYEAVFTDTPSSSREADEIFTLLWSDEAVKATAPAWFTEKAQAELAASLEKLVNDACLADAAAREKARTRLRPTVKAQRAQPVPFSPQWLAAFDEKEVLADFQVTLKPELLKQHPRLFFTKAEMPLLYARIAGCQSKTWPLFVANIEANLNSQYRTMASFREKGSLGTGTGDVLAQLAFVYGLTRDDAQGELVKRLVQGYCAEEIWDPPFPDLVHAHVLTGLALAYDAAQACLMPEERDKVRDKLILEAQRIYKTTCAPKRLRTPGNANNHSWIQKCGLAVAAAAVYEHTPEAKAWLDRVRWEYEKILVIHGPDGASCEGTSYWAYGLMWMLKYMELLWRTSGENMYEYPWLRQTGYYALYCLSPGGALHVNFGDNGEEQGRVSMIPYRLASEFRDEHIQWLGDQLQWNPNMKGKSGANIWAFLWHDPTVGMKPPDDLPPYRYFSDLEMVVVKSSWKDDAKMLAFRCGPPMGYSVFEHGASGYGHAQPDQNHFIFFAGGSRFIVSDPGYSRWKMTDEHNLILVDGIGQIGEESHWLHYVYKADELAEMQEVFLSPAYSYMRGDAHRAYRRELGIKTAVREVLFFDGRYLVVFDAIASDAPRKFEWLLHSWNPIEGPAKNVFTSVQDDARLATTMLMPDQFDHAAKPMMVKSAVKWGTDGKPVYIQDPVQHGFYLSVSPKEKSPSACFLAVHWPYKKGEEETVPACTRLVGKEYVGVEIARPERDSFRAGAKGHDRVLFNLSNGMVEADGVATDAPRAVVRTNEVFEPVGCVLHDGRALTCGACELVKASAPIILQYNIAAGEATAETKSPAELELYAPGAVSALEVNGSPAPFAYDAASKTLKLKIGAGRSELKLR